MIKINSKKLIDKIERTTLFIIMGLGVFMLLIAWAHIFYRYVLNDSLSWSEEFLKLCLVWFSLLSASIISKKSEHMGIVIFRNKMPINVQKILKIIIKIIMLVACIIVTCVGIILTFNSMNKFTPALGIPFSYAYAAIPVSFLIMTVYEVIHILNKNYENNS